MKIIESYLTKNPCYKANVNKISKSYKTFQTRGPIGIMIHSVGTPQPKASVFINSWNKITYTRACVHAFVEPGSVYQTLPWTFRGWHAGGEANNTHIGVELTEPSTIKYTSGSGWIDNNREKTKEYVLGTYRTAVELFAFLCLMYNLDPLTDGVIISHSEGHKKGIASNHGDVEHIWKMFSITMDQFRKDIKEAMGNSQVNDTEISKNEESPLTFDSINVGDEFKFIGKYQFVSANSTVGTPVTSNVKVVVTKKYKKNSLHPIHVRSINEQGNYTSGAYGWVDISELKYINESFKPYLVKVTADSLNIRKGPTARSSMTGVIKDKGVYTIIEESDGWGLLKSKAGWINLSYTKKI